MTQEIWCPEQKKDMYWINNFVFALSAVTTNFGVLKIYYL